ncbi:methyltransferase domain-containing protein [Purpureocillium lavendulum]|uniref:Methyltransferase domain-containing protein n=1 Tax=Purpureocillium lavendulum TaxID=1247861 RepID=A0AB34FYZ7_9HYPO|nr:methyltransferase domain-containing protein [Purpureocillium lavendulum]
MLPESAGGGVESLVFYLDRGNGQVTRLIPADILPPLGKVPAREAYHPGMVVLGSPGGEMAQGIAGLNERACIKGNPDRQVTRAVAASTVNGGSSSRSSSGRRHKVYCDKWIHEGVCAFTQQGCRFKHEMPFDEATQRLLGLFQGLPGWYRKSQDERADRMPITDADGSQRYTGHTTMAVLSFRIIGVQWGRRPGSSLQALACTWTP